MSSDVVWVSPVNVAPRGYFEESDDSDDENVAPASIEPPLYPPEPPCCSVVVKSALHGTVTINGTEGLTVGALKERVKERVMLRPSRLIHLAFYGRELPDSATLEDCHVKTGGKLDMRVDYMEEERMEKLERVRVVSTAIKTRLFLVDQHTTGLEIKQKYAQVLQRGEHRWHGKDGEAICVSGATVLSTGNVARDEKTGTSRLRIGEELVVPGNFFEPSKKVIAVHRANSGTLVAVHDGGLVPLVLPPPKLRLSWAGKDVADGASLWNLGVPNDSDLMIEFESPAMPPILQLMRSPDKPGKAKGSGGKKKGKGGGKGKGKKKK